MMARFQRGTTRVRLVRDVMGDGFYTFTESSDTQTVQHHALKYYPLHVDLYLVNGYTRLELCQTCQGKGWRWVSSNHGEDAERDMCPKCQGEGGAT